MKEGLKWDEISVPDFYSELDFGERAQTVLDKIKECEED